MGSVAKTRKRNVVAEFSLWFTRRFGFRDYFGSPDLKRTMSQASRLRREGFDLDIAKEVLEAMAIAGLDVKTPYAIKWQSPDRTNTWYDFSKPALPPLWDKFGQIVSELDGVPARIV